MTLDEMKSAVCKKLPELLTSVGTPQQTVVDYWHDKTRDRYPIREINWPTEGLQVCHEAVEEYELTCEIAFCPCFGWVVKIGNVIIQNKDLLTAWLEAICRVWFPKRFK